METPETGAGLPASCPSGLKTNHARSTPRRDYTHTAERVLIVGLDGATFDVLDPMMQAGLMPRLSKAVAQGARGILRSTVPPLTPAAWTTFMTGKHPGTHGVIDFEYYDVWTGALQLHQASPLNRVESLWHVLGDAGFRVGVINVPMTYPPVPVQGFMVSGFETPGPHAQFVYPGELREDVLSRWSDPTFGKNWKRGRGLDLFRQNVEYMSRSFHQGAEMAAYLGDRCGWDVLMVVLKLVDNLQHKTWKYIDPRWADRDPARRDIVRGCFAELDRAIGSLLDYAAAHQATVIMVSDHGHGSQEGKVYPNVLLKRWGYLALQPPGRRWARSIRRKWFGKKAAGSISPMEGLDGVEGYLPVDLTRTRACVMHAGNAAFVYINLKGRQPSGIVDPADYEAMRDELAARFRSDECRVPGPDGRILELFPEVHKPEELYGRPRAQAPWMPDLMLIQHETLAAVRQLHHRPTWWAPYRRIEGTHRPEGILIATGPGVRTQQGMQAYIGDCAPTILAMMGISIPEDMEGRVLTEMLHTPPSIRMRGARAPMAVEPGDQNAYTEEELELVTQRLADLGYLQ